MDRNRTHRSVRPHRGESVHQLLQPLRRYRTRPSPSSGTIRDVTTRIRPDVVVFDVVETLASLDAVQSRLSRLQQPSGLLQRWFARLLRDAMVITAAHGYCTFLDVAASSLQAETRGTLTPEQIDFAVAGFRELTAQPDAAEAIDTAKRAGFRVFTLSNGSEEATRAFLARAGLTPQIEEVLSVDEVKIWKPAPEPYELAISRARVPAERVALVAVHSWDIHGAHRAGLTTGWCPRLETVATPAFTEADVSSDTLPGVIDALAALPR
ncbi:haloacid dehalogenase type II [Rhodococcus xishaensis]|uniref:Haloacid dehalogenase type II n=1 Tax=Rhodococcus xishaensis TaxID=2487364 RepID=A0A3S3AAY2_9NOCA|nr:haloacid dehalogenase type II [Rhodococcus xishaensis]